MRRHLIVVLALLCVFGMLLGQSRKPLPEVKQRKFSQRDWRPMLGTGIGFGVQNGAGFQFNIDALVPVSVLSGLYVRTSMIGLWAGSGTMLEFGTGSSVELLYFFPQHKFNPYIGGGLHLNAMAGFTTFSFMLGAGAQFSLPQSPVKPYGEIGFGVLSANDTDVLFSMALGVRFEI